MQIVVQPTPVPNEHIDDRVAALLQEGANIDLNYNDASNTLTISSSGSSAYTNEEAQDAVGTILVDTATIDFTYDDATPAIIADVKDSSITEAKLSLSDITTQNVNITRHGLVPKAPNNVAQYLDGTGAWSTPAGGTNYWTRTPGNGISETNLIAFWRMEEASGNRVDNKNSIVLVPTGTPANAAGKNGQALAFTSAASTYLSAADSANLSVGAAQDFTIACWIYFNGTPSGSRGIIGKGNASISYNNCEYLLGTSGTSLIWYIRATNVIASGITLAATTWYFVVAWYDSVADIQYIQVNNGTPSQLANSTGSFDSADVVEVGRQPQWSGSAPFDGRIDNLMFWKRTLSADERTTLFNSGNGVDYPFSLPTLSPATVGDQISSALLLTDFPDSYAANALKILRVNAAANATEFGPVLGTMAEQNANAVAITGGTAVFTGDEIARQHLTLNTVGDNIAAFYSEVAAAGGTNRWGVYHVANAPSYFGGTVQMVGNLGVGMAPGVARVEIIHARASNNAITIRPDSDVAGAYAIGFVNAAVAYVGSISCTATTTTYGTSSDARLKHAIQPLTGALARILTLKPIAYLWNADDSPGEGFAAHELQQQIPLAVTGEPDALNDDGSIKPQQVDHSKLVPWLTAALQEAYAQIQALTARVEALEGALG